MALIVTVMTNLVPRVSLSPPPALGGGGGGGGGGRDPGNEVE